MSASGINIEKMTNKRRMENSGGRTVMPEPAGGKSYMESVISFFQGWSQASPMIDERDTAQLYLTIKNQRKGYAHKTPVEEREPIAWGSFFTYSDALGYEGVVDSANSPLLLLLGYPNGMQMWNLMANGEAQEMFSLREGPVKTACVIPPPPPSADLNDPLEAKRPLMAICLATDSKQVFASVFIRSLRNGEQVRRLSFPSDVVSMHAGPAPLLVITLIDSIHAYDSRTLDLVFVIKGCYPGTGFISNPICLGKRWLAYSPSLPHNGLQSAGGVIGNGVQSYVTSVFNAAKKIGRGISTVSDTVNWLAFKSHLASYETPPAAPWESQRSADVNGSVEIDGETGCPGLVTVVDTTRILQSLKMDDGHRRRAVEIESDIEASLVVAHFVAHVGQPIACMEWGPSGKLLATADVLGHTFHIFQILSHSMGSTLGAVHHLYTLWRGDTLAQVQELRFSCDSRWLIASTLRGTGHIFPITPYGGRASVRTHTSDRLVNRFSTYHKSAGLDEIEYVDAQYSSYRHLTDGSNNNSQRILGWQNHHRILAPKSQAPSNPRRPPLPFPINVQALAHIRHGPMTPTNLSSVLPTQVSYQAKTTDTTSLPPKIAHVVISSMFLQASDGENGRKDHAGSGFSASTSGSQRLLIASSSGYLTEYLLEPRPEQGAVKVCGDTSVELTATPRVCWALQRRATWNTLPLILSPRNPVILAEHKCHSHYQVTMLRHKYRRKEITQAHGDLASQGMTVRNQQPKSRDKNSLKTDLSYVRTGELNRDRSSKPNKYIPSVTERNQAFSSENHRCENNVLNGGIGKSSMGEESGLSGPGWKKIVKESSSEEWLSKVEMMTHSGPARRLWMGPQFRLKRRLSTGNTHVLSSVSSSLLSDYSHQVGAMTHNGLAEGGAQGADLYEEDLDVHSLPIHSTQTQPVATPFPRRGEHFDDYNVTEENGITIEAGSGNFDRTHDMLEIMSYGSFDDNRNGGEGKLLQRIADAMQDCNGDVTVRKLSSSPPFATSSSPSMIPILRRVSDPSDFGSIPLEDEAEHFNFVNG